MSTINQAYINALLADAAYVAVARGMNSGQLKQALEERMTLTQAAFIASNFDVLDSIETPDLLGSGFDAVVWKGKADTPYDGKVYVSMRGTQSAQDIADDGDLASAGVPYRQIVSMVNWWLKATTVSNSKAPQIKTDIDNNFVGDLSVDGAGTLLNIGSIESVNGHSLGGYLATAFARLFGQQWGIQTVNTFNSAGFNRLRENDNIQTAFSQIAQLVGVG